MVANYTWLFQNSKLQNAIPEWQVIDYHSRMVSYKTPFQNGKL